MKPGSEAAGGASVHDHLVMADDEGYHPHDPHAHHRLHEDPDGLHLEGEAKIDSVEAAIMAVATAGTHVGAEPPSPITATGRTRKITRSKPGQGLKQRARCAVEGCDKQVSARERRLPFRCLGSTILNLLACLGSYLVGFYSLIRHYLRYSNPLFLHLPMRLHNSSLQSLQIIISQYSLRDLGTSKCAEGIISTIKRGTTLNWQPKSSGSWPWRARRSVPNAPSRAAPSNRRAEYATVCAGRISSSRAPKFRRRTDQEGCPGGRCPSRCHLSSPNLRRYV